MINKSNPEVQDYFLTNPDSVSRYWLKNGASWLAQDVMGDASFPNGYWETFREVVKTDYPDALIIGELWQKDSTLLRFLRGDRADTTMNYRLRDAVLGLLSPGRFDSKGFGDSGRIITVSEFAARLASIREDYPDAAYYSLMNLLDSHDTERLLWTLTPGSETTADKENNAANLAEGRHRQQIAALIQFSMPGAPTVYYGDEVGLTGDDDPDDRRTYPWIDSGGEANYNVMRIYRTLAILRKNLPALTDGDLSILLADDATDTVVYGRKTTSQAALVAINRSAASQTISIPVAGYLPDGTPLHTRYWAGPKSPAFATLVRNGQIQLTLPAMSALLLATNSIDLQPPAAPLNLHVTDEGSQQVSLTWNRVARTSSYNLYRSPVSGGGWVRVNSGPLTTTSFTDTGLRNAHRTTMSSPPWILAATKAQSQIRSALYRTTQLVGLTCSGLHRSSTQSAPPTGLPMFMARSGSTAPPALPDRPKACWRSLALARRAPIRMAARIGCGLMLSSMSMPATTMSLWPACCPTRPAALTMYFGTPPPTAATGCTPT